MNPIPEFEKYPFKIEPLSADDGGGYFVTFPDLPGCMADGDSYEAAIADARDAFQAWMDARIAEGRAVPLPNGEGEPAKYVQRLPQSLHGQLLKAAAQEGVSMNTLVTTFVAVGLATREGRQSLAPIEQAVAQLIGNLQNATLQATYESNNKLFVVQEPATMAMGTFPCTDVGSGTSLTVSQLLISGKSVRMQ